MAAARPFAGIRAVDGLLHLERAGVVPAGVVTQIRIAHKSWPYDPDDPEWRRNRFGRRRQVRLAVRTTTGRRYTSGPASLTAEERAALVAAWRELCPAATLTERRLSDPLPLTNYD